LRKSGYPRIRGSELHLSGIRTAQQEIRNSSREPGILTFGNSFGLIKNVRIVLRARFDDVILESSTPASRCLANITYSALDLAINIFTRRYVDSSNLSLLFPCLELINPHTLRYRRYRSMLDPFDPFSRTSRYSNYEEN